MVTGVLEGMYDVEIKYIGYKTEVRRKVRVENALRGGQRGI